MPSSKSPLSPIVDRWLNVIDKGKDYKRPFQSDADEALTFFSSDADAIWGDIAQNKFGKAVGLPPFRMVVNRLWEAVRIFAAVIHHRNPNRAATPKQLPTILPQQLGIVDQPVPQMGPNGPVIGPDGQPVMMPSPQMMEYQQMAAHQQMLADHRVLVSSLLEMYLNYTPNELDLQGQSRQVVEEAFIKGAGVWWHELYQPAGATTKIAGSFFDTIDNLVWDPDADKFDDIRWMARRRIRPVDEVADEFGLERDWLKGHAESYSMQADSKHPDYKFKKATGQTNDLIEYWEIYSKTGFGDRLKDADEKIRGMFDSLGQNCYIVVAKGVDFPLNIHPRFMQAEVSEEEPIPQELFLAAQWPIPFWVEPNGWPCTVLKWHGKPNYTWPLTVVAAGMGELRFINWAMSYLITRIQKTADSIIAVAKDAEDSLKKQIEAPSERGLKVIELSGVTGARLAEMIQVFDQPTVSQEMFNIISEVTAMFDRRVGLTELIYGMTSSAMRSATESQIKSDQISIRPDDYANILETAMSTCARREAIMSRWMIHGQDVLPIMGPLGARAWEMHVRSMDIESVAREFDYRVEAGSTRKPNISTRIENFNQAMQIFMPVAQGLLQAGQPKIFNALAAMFGRVNEMDVSELIVPPPPPPPAPQGGPPPGNAPQPPQGPPPPGQ